MNQKRCKKCSVIKPLDAFHAQSAGLYGRTARCIECTKAEQAEYRESKRPMSVKEARVRKETLRSRGLKDCRVCREVKPVTEFFLVDGRPMSRCKKCNAENHKKWKSKNPEHMLQYVRDYTGRQEVKERKTASRQRRVAETPRIVMQITLRHGLKRRPTENPATIDDLMGMFDAQDGKCAVTGIVMTWAKGTVLPTSISLDRIDHNGGYSADNLRLICHAVNAFKGRMSDAEMLTMARAIVNRTDATSPEPTWESFAVSPHRNADWMVH